MTVWQMVGLCVIAALLCVVLRPLHPELAMILSLAAGSILLLAVVGEIGQVLALAQKMMEKAHLPGAYMPILLKALGICLLTQVACDTCRDVGETALSVKLEMAGKIAVLVLSLPLFEEILMVIQALIAPAGGY